MDGLIDIINLSIATYKLITQLYEITPIYFILFMLAQEL